MILTGAATDDIGVVSVGWTSDRGSKGVALGTSSWTTGGIDLAIGLNVLTVTATDAVGNRGTATVTVTRIADIQDYLN
jgi:hypothetical protein